jgi:hypothetical protein
MQPNNIIGPAKALTETVGYHGPRAINGLLGRLSDEHERAAPMVLDLRLATSPGSWASTNPARSGAVWPTTRSEAANSKIETSLVI